MRRDDAIELCLTSLCSIPSFPTHASATPISSAPRQDRHRQQSVPSDTENIKANRPGDWA